jgi:hypothetical protein
MEVRDQIQIDDSPFGRATAAGVKKNLSVAGALCSFAKSCSDCTGIQNRGTPP